MAMEKFHYTFKDGKKITLPKADQLPFGVLRKMRKIESEQEQTLFLLEEVLGEESKEMKSLDCRPVVEVGELMEAWTKDAGTGSGK